ncbi:hypothetical protein PIN17_A1773 [Prevotella intermedia 17]|nr:hypothetical protein PIN17_A1773 [Prevotella intermedia 17]APW34636.1 hypothetical protein BWX40_07225 [Prevotella intermedia]
MHNSLYINVLQNLLFCIPKAAVLHGKSVGFASQNSRFRNAKSKLPFFLGIIFTKTMIFFCIFLKRQRGNQFSKKGSTERNLQFLPNCILSNIKVKKKIHNAYLNTKFPFPHPSSSSGTEMETLLSILSYGLTGLIEKP